MNQEKIGKFIAQCRREKNLTQAQLAEHFGISNRAVSKWETGRSLPDASIMIELCNLLGITVNELLSGERMVGMQEYQRKAEDNIVEMQKQLKSYRSRLIVNNVFLLAIAVLSLFMAPYAVVFVVLVMAFRDYYLVKNMRAVQHILNKEKG